GTDQVASPVETRGTRGAGAGQPDRAEQGDDGDDQAEDDDARLSFSQGDEGEEEVRRHGGDDVRAVLLFVRGEVVDAERGEAAQQQADQGGGQDDHLDALPALLAPVDVVEVEDQRELVEDQARADAEDHGGDGRAEAVPSARDRGEAADDGEDDAGHDVVDVQVAGLHVAEGALARADQAGDDPGDDEGEDEGGEREEQRQLARLDDVPLQPMSHMRTLSMPAGAALLTTG